MNEEFYIDAQDLCPSQLYISEAKLNRVKQWLVAEQHNYDPIPIKKYGERVHLTDGHTRAVHVLMSGESKIKVIWDTDDLDDHVYETCISWCDEEEISSLSDLIKRVIPEHEYQKLWLNRCKSLE